MYKVAIITITNSGLNFGNRLQNYALQKKVEQYGIKVETIFSSKGVKNSVLMSRLRYFLKLIVKQSARRRRFTAFNHQYIHKCRIRHYEYINDKKFSDMYDGFIIGSDQVWNPYFSFNTSFEFAQFAPPYKRFTYAASFGSEEIPPNRIAEYKKWISEISLLSIREEQGKNLVAQLTGRDSELSIDPTMLLKPEEYYQIEKRPQNIQLPKRYLLMYYLGEVPEEYKRHIEQIAKDKQIPIEYLSESKGTKYYNIGPCEFIYMFHHAEYICTDSFHGTVFSILFHKQFTTYGRKGKDNVMNSRINTLLSLFHLQQRIYGNKDYSMDQLTYEEVDRLLEEQKIKTDKYMKRIVQELSRQAKVSEKEIEA